MSDTSVLTPEHRACHDPTACDDPQSPTTKHVKTIQRLRSTTAWLYWLHGPSVPIVVCGYGT
jgi:hypothetical protein